MKILLVLCALIALVYCDWSEIVIEDNCIGIKYITPDQPSSSGYLIPGSWTKHEICCDEGFNPDTKISGFSKNMKIDDISKVLSTNYATLTKDKTNCKEQASGVAK